MDKSTGFCLDGIEERLDHAKWYYGNYYIVKCWRDENRPVHPVILSELALYEENMLILLDGSSSHLIFKNGCSTSMAPCKIKSAFEVAKKP